MPSEEPGPSPSSAYWRAALAGGRVRGQAWLGGRTSKSSALAQFAPWSWRASRPFGTSALRSRRFGDALLSSEGGRLGAGSRNWEPG